MGKSLVSLTLIVAVGFGLAGCSASVQAECDNVYSEVKNMDSEWNQMQSMADVETVSESYRTIALKLAAMKFANKDLEDAITDFSESTLALASGMTSDTTTESQANQLRNKNDLAWAGLAKVCGWKY